MTDMDKIVGYYGQFDEWGRLDTPSGQVVFERTCSLFDRHLQPDSRILDLACGPGRLRDCSRSETGRAGIR